jgi:hypothetical protein
MTHHNIAGSEVGRHRPLAYLQEVAGKGRRSRQGLRQQLKAVHPAVWLHLAMIPLGVTLGLIDALLIGKPYCIVVAIAALVAWFFWPTSR